MEQSAETDLTDWYVAQDGGLRQMSATSFGKFMEKEMVSLERVICLRVDVLFIRGRKIFTLHQLKLFFFFIFLFNKGKLKWESLSYFQSR
jgi:hypothetical protein